MRSRTGRARMRRLLTALLSMSACGVNACSESTSPLPLELLTVALSVRPGFEVLMGDTFEGPLITCTYDIDARASGSGTASWFGGELRLYTGPDRTVVFDSYSFSAEEMRAAWGAATVTGGSVQEMRFRVSFPIPFDVEFEATFGDRSAKVRAECGPRPPASGLLPPVIESVNVTGKEELHPGDTVNVTIHSRSNYALWYTEVGITGPVEQQFRFMESGRVAGERTMQLVIPPDSRPDVPLAVEIVVTDAAAISTRRVVTTTKRTTDTALPVLNGARFAGHNPCCSSDIREQLSAGDRLLVRINASDDLGLAWVVAEVNTLTPFRDSVPAPSPPDSTVGFNVTDRWVNARSVAIHVRDRAGKRSTATIMTAADSINFYPGVTRPMLQLDFPVTQGIPAYDEARQRFYVPDGMNQRIAVVDATTMTVTSMIAVGTWVSGLDLSANGDTLVAVLPADTKLAVVDLRPATPVVTRVTIAPPTGLAFSAFNPTDVKRDANGAWHVVGYRLPSPAHALIVDLTSGASTVVDGASTGSALRIQPNADRTRLAYIGGACSRVHLVTTGALGTCRELGGNGWEIPTTLGAPSSERYSHGHRLLDADLADLAGSPVLNFVFNRIGWSRDESILWVAEFDMLARVRASDFRRLDRQNIPFQLDYLWTSADGNYLYALSRFRNSLFRLDLR